MPKPLSSVSENSVPAHIFKEYDIRGVVADSLTCAHMELIGQAFGTECQAMSVSGVFVASDARLSSPELKDGLIKGLRRTGCDVIDVGTVPTPVLYHAVSHSTGGTGLMVTASHNPPQYNGVKMVLGHTAIFGDAIQKLRQRIVDGDLLERAPGKLLKKSIVADYCAAIQTNLRVQRPLRVVLDCANGVAGAIAPGILRDIGCEVIELYCDVDGSFPNHPADPTRPENLADLIAAVVDNKADVGLALDGDGDRLVAISPPGEIVWPDRLMILFVEDILAQHPGRTVVFDVKCMRALADAVVRAGGVPVLWKTGHSLIRAKLNECNGIFGGEMSGHLYFNDRWPGFDDGLYASARLCELLSLSHSSANEIFAVLPSSVSTPEIRIPCESPHKLVERFTAHAKFPGANLVTIDGLRATFEDGFGLLRASNTAPEIVLRFDADSTAALTRIQESFAMALSPLLEDAGSEVSLVDQFAISMDSTER